MPVDQFRHKSRIVVVQFSRPVFEGDRLAFHVSEIRQSFLEDGQAFRIDVIVGHVAKHRYLLRPGFRCGEVDESCDNDESKQRPKLIEFPPSAIKGM